MADDSFRSNSNSRRNSWPHGEGARDGGHDPLAELAQLIGQGDPYAERSVRRSADEVAPGFDWAANEDYADEGGHAEEHHAPPPLPPASYSTYANDEQDYADEPPTGGRYFSGSAGKFNGFGADAGPYEPDQQAPVSSSRQLPAFISAAPVGPYEAEEPDRAQEAGEDYGDYAEEYYDEPPRPRRRGLVVMMAVLGLVIVGAAGAFAYRNMFGGAVFAGLPPIIKASITPNKILPKNGDAQADNSAQTGTSAQANSDKLVSHEEQPVNMEPPKVGSRVVATIPISGGQMAPPLVAAAPAPAALRAPHRHTARHQPARRWCRRPTVVNLRRRQRRRQQQPHQPLRRRQQLRPSPKRFTQSSYTPTSPVPQLRSPRRRHLRPRPPRAAHALQRLRRVHLLLRLRSALMLQCRSCPVPTARQPLPRLWLPPRSRRCARVRQLRRRRRSLWPAPSPAKPCRRRVRVRADTPCR